MIVTIKKGTLNGKIKVPPSKSYAHRYLIGEALSLKGKVSNIDYSKDIEATISCLKSLGISFIKRFDSIEFLGMDKTSASYTFDCLESASTLRFFIPISLVFTNHAKFIGTQKLIERGISEYESSFIDKGIKIKKGFNYIELDGSLKPGIYTLNGNVSSQFISGLLFSLPLLNGDSRIDIVGELESFPYVKMTMDVLKKYGIDILFEANSFFINGGQKYTETYPIIEGDYSNAAFLDAYNYLGSNIELEGLNKTSIQGDTKYKDFFDGLNESYKEINIKNNIDLGPVLIAFSSLKNGAKLIGTKRLKIKESRRDEAMMVELKKIGIDIKILDDSIIIPKYNGNHKYIEFDSHNDHRVLMSLCLFSSLMDVKIINAECINKSYPNFFNDLIKLGLDLKVE